MKLEFTIPGPITPWQRATPAGRVLTTKAHRRYMAHVRVCGRAAVLAQTRGRWPIDARYDVTLRLCFQDERPRDDDNVEKILKDGLKGVLWADDRWKFFRRIEKTMELDRVNPRVEVTVEVVR